MASYITVTQADSRYQKHLPITMLKWENNDYVAHDVWADATQDEKQQSLDMATAYINDLDLDGQKTVPSQDNAFPRQGDTSTPEDVKRACFLLALFFLEENKTREFADPTVRKAMEAGLERYTADVQNASESFWWKSGYVKTPYSVVSPYLKKWIKGRYNITRWRG